MSEISNIGQTFPAASWNSTTTLRSVSPHSEASALDPDLIEFSVVGKALAVAFEHSSLRAAKAAAIRAEISNGTFETPERIKGTVDRLLDVIA